jgi:regulator of protease activity HflC (stomatin/prohibitin superfamily)
MDKQKLSLGIGISVVVLFLALTTFTTVPAGHVGVGSLFGKVETTPYAEGFNFKNPMAKVTLFDARQKTHLETMNVPSQDQLTTQFEISIQYRLIKEKAPQMLTETGTPKEVLAVHMIPLLRSQLRELGKSVSTAEEFYNQQIQQRIQDELLVALADLNEKGIKVEKLLIRDVILPKIITTAVLRKKEAAQAAEKAKEELKKFKVDQERKEAKAIAEKRAELIAAQKKKEVLLIEANAQLDATRIDAQAVLVSAKAKAEANTLLIKSLTLEGYIKLESMKYLKAFQNGNHVIIMDPNSVSPLPFLNLDQAKK